MTYFLIIVAITVIYFIFRAVSASPFDEGCKAGNDGARIDANPYRSLTQRSKHTKWNAGWLNTQTSENIGSYFTKTV